jgi:CBS domain-containing protein
MKTVRQLLQAKGSQVSTIAPSATAYDAMKLMAEKNIGALLVFDRKDLVGIISERDIARKIYLLEQPARQIRVSEIMTKQVVCVGPDHTNEECMALITDKRIRHLPVLGDGQVVGIISIGDLVKDTIAEQQFIIEQLEHYIKGER